MRAVMAATVALICLRRFAPEDQFALVRACFDWFLVSMLLAELLLDVGR